MCVCTTTHISSSEDNWEESPASSHHVDLGESALAPRVPAQGAGLSTAPQAGPAGTAAYGGPRLQTECRSSMCPLPQHCPASTLVLWVARGRAGTERQGPTATHVLESELPEPRSRRQITLLSCPQFTKLHTAAQVSQCGLGYIFTVWVGSSGLQNELLCPQVQDGLGEDLASGHQVSDEHASLFLEDKEV